MLTFTRVRSRAATAMVPVLLAVAVLWTASTAQPATVDTCEHHKGLCDQVETPMIRNQLLEWYGVIPPRIAFPEPTNCTGHGTDMQSFLSCRKPDAWCPMQPSQQQDAPPRLFGTIPCQLLSTCKGLADTIRFYRPHGPSGNLERCLRNKRIVALGDSVLQELTLELMMTLAEKEPVFSLKMLTLEHKFRTANALKVSHGPLSVTYHNTGRNYTFTDSRLNFTLQYLFSGGLNLSDHGGLRTLVEPEFESELQRLGLHQTSSPAERPDVLLTGNTFHDDTKMGDLNSQCVSQCECNKTFSTLTAEYSHYGRLVAFWLHDVQKRGTKVVWHTLFGRLKKPYNARVDPLRAVVEKLALDALDALGFFEAGGQAVDLWPLYSAYFNEGSKTPVFGDGITNGGYGPSSLHHAALSVRDWHIPPDLIAMRVQWTLNLLCSTSSAELCGDVRDEETSYFLHQAAAVHRKHAMCSCGPFGMSIAPAYFCNPSTPIGRHVNFHDQLMVDLSRKWSQFNHSRRANTHAKTAQKHAGATASRLALMEASSASSAPGKRTDVEALTKELDEVEAKAASLRAKIKSTMEH